jgi:chromosome segregation ATPase
MDNLAYLGAGSGAILFIGALGMAHRATQLRDDLAKANRKIEEIQQELKLVKNNLIQVKSIDLDFSVVESQIEETEQRILSYVSQEVSGLNSAIKDLEARVDKLEDEYPVLRSSVESLEEEAENES